MKYFTVLLAALIWLAGIALAAAAAKGFWFTALCVFVPPFSVVWLYYWAFERWLPL